MLACSCSPNFCVARKLAKKFLISACARKKIAVLGMLGNARKDHSSPLIFNCIFLVKFWRYSIYKYQMSSEKKHLTLFFVSVFLHFVFFINSIKVFYFMQCLCFKSMHEQLLFVFWQSSHTRTCLPFTAVSMLIAHATLVHRSNVSMTLSIQNFLFLLYRVARFW